MTTPDSEPPPAAANDVSHASDLRAAARWLIGASASVVAVLVAGVQLGDFASVDEVGPGAVASALLGALTSLITVAWTLYSAAAVLATPRRSIDELAELDRADNSNFPHPRVKEPASALISYLVVDRRTDLLGPSRDAIWQLVGDRALAHKAATLPRSPGEKIQIGIHEYNTDKPSDNAALANLNLDLERRVQRVVDAALFFETQRRYNRLVKSMKLAGVPFVVSLLLLLWLQTLPPVLMNVKTPTSVQVMVPPSKSDPCSGKTLEGIAVGGTMDAPIVVLPSQAGCPAKKLADTDELVVVPRPAK
ncbi:hypothetical protein GBF35_45850 [Nonomuraea phyllanthi]|uniref:hypothetical protein n=1 Tax=Nonomuraea phyllanthi TaxID=2219224 RepID=UPI0012933219|nr:hypothetical protein [Nonomuraea phyllanthi]QFY12915.1 hypothetical protein GBF35_45850 [Nonomuraea phyllanthi]